MLVDRTDDSPRAILGPLRYPSFTRLLVARTVNEAGNWLGLVALAALVYAQTSSVIATAALMVSMQVLPALIAPALIGRVEAHDLRRVLIGLYAIEAVAFAALALLAQSFLLPAVLAIAAFDGVLALSARALTRAGVAAVLEPTGELRAGNALINVGATLAIACGPIAGGFLVAGAGAAPALLIDAASFLLCALVLVSSPPLPRLVPEAEPVTGWRERLREALAYVRDNALVRRLLVGQALALACFALTVPVDVAYATDTLGAGEQGFGLLLGFWGLGMVAGGLIFAAGRRFSLALILAGSTVLMGIAYLGLAAAPTLALALAASLLGGVGNGIQWVALVTTVQELVGARLQARVVGLLESSASGADALGFFAGAAIAVALAPRASYLVAGLGVLIVTCLFFLRLPRRKLTSLDARPQAAA